MEKYKKYAKKKILEKNGISRTQLFTPSKLQTFTRMFYSYSYGVFKLIITYRRGKA